DRHPVGGPDAGGHSRLVAEGVEDVGGGVVVAVHRQRDVAVAVVESAKGDKSAKGDRVLYRFYRSVKYPVPFSVSGDLALRRRRETHQRTRGGRLSLLAVY